ncbi:MAG: hypothetical protein IKK43_03715 [Clostridia bacterium]|nr:hypothetical protein [Clostridia bacterium]
MTNFQKNDFEHYYPEHYCKPIIINNNIVSFSKILKELGFKEQEYTKCLEDIFNLTEKENNSIIYDLLCDTRNSLVYSSIRKGKESPNFNFKNPKIQNALTYFLAFNPNAIKYFFENLEAMLGKKNITPEQIDNILNELSEEKINTASQNFLNKNIKQGKDNSIYILEAEDFKEYWSICFSLENKTKLLGIVILYSLLNVKACFLLDKITSTCFNDFPRININGIVNNDITTTIQNGESYVIQSSLNPDMFLGFNSDKKLYTISKTDINIYSKFTFESITPSTSYDKTETTIIESNEADALTYSALRPIYSVINSLIKFSPSQNVLDKIINCNKYGELNKKYYYIKVNNEYMKLENNNFHAEIILGKKNDNNCIWEVGYYNDCIYIKPYRNFPLSAFALDIPNGNRTPGVALWLFLKYNTLSQQFKLFKVDNKHT